MTHGKIPFSGFSNWKFLKRSSLGLTTCHVNIILVKRCLYISCHVNIILVKKVFSMFLILPQWHLHYPYMPLGPKENLPHHGKIVPWDEFVNCFVNFLFMVSFVCFSWFWVMGELNTPHTTFFVCLFLFLSYLGFFF